MATFQSFGTGNISCGNVTNSNNIITVNQTDDEDNQIKQWLSPLQPQHRHQSVRTNRVDGVGSWLQERNEFREWSGSQDVPEQAVLFCYGDPGAGKTHISSLVIDWLCDKRDVAVAGLYCDYLAQEEQSTTNMLGAILKQLFEGYGIPGHARQAFRKGRRGFGGRAVQLLDLVEMLKATIASLPEVFICIDGLDECFPNKRQELLVSLQDIVQESPRARVFLSGRPHVWDEVKGYFPDAIMLPVIPTIGDIKRYLKLRLDRDTTPGAMDDNLRVAIMRAVPGKISQSFLLVSLNIDAVLEEVTIHQRRKKLHQMIQGNGLRDAYAATIARIKAQKGSKSRLGMEVLMWLSHSERPLNADELRHALGVEIGTTDLNSRNAPAIETLLGCSLGLVIVESSSHTVRLVHYTLKEYLSNNTHLFHSPQSMIAQVCLTYLNFQCVRDLSPFLDWSPQATPLLEYASCYWGTHARREMAGSVKSLALRLLDGFDHHVSSGLLLSSSYDNWDPKLKRSNPTGFTGLHCAAYLGVHEIVVALLEMKKWDLNATDMKGNTAILWAVRKGHGAIVKLLLEREDAIPDTADEDGRTLLSWAAEDGHGDVVEMLLEREDITPDTADKDGRTPLSRAAERGHGGVVEMLLEREDVTPDTTDTDGRTPLSWAAERGHGDVVEMLLEREDVTPDTADTDGRTPLSWAARYGHGYGDVVEMLLEREDVTPDTTDNDGRTPLSWAAANGHEDIVGVLLESGDVTSDISDNDGRTPLLWAAKYGHRDIVEMLLGRGDAAPGAVDAGGRTPLSWAAEYGHSTIVKILLEREDFTPDTADKDGRTPLSWVAANGHGDVVEMLLEREDLIPDTADNCGQTPLSWAAECGHGDIVKMLLEREDVTPDTADKYGGTPLLWAAVKGHSDVVEMLLERDDVNPNTADKDGRTPLSFATEYGHTGVMEMLQERCCLSQDITVTDHAGLTAFAPTSKSQHGGVVKRLLENQASVPRLAGGNMSMSLSSASPPESSQRPPKRVRRS